LWFCLIVDGIRGHDPELPAIAMPKPQDAPALFAINASRAFGEQVARALGVALGAHEEREFDDGEHKIRPLENVRGRDVYLIQSLYSEPRQSVNDKLCRMLFFLGALRDAGAGRLTAVIPYLAYARKDAKTQTRDPVTTRYVAALIESLGVDRVVTLDVHNLAAYQNAFRCRSEHLETNKLFVSHLAPLLAGESRVAVVSPDVGGIKRAERFRHALGRALKREPAAAFVEKARARGTLSLGRLVGEVEGSNVVIVDDMVGTGSTLAHAAQVCKQQGAQQVVAAAAHGLFVGRASETLAEPALDRILVTDSVPPFRLDPALAERKLVVLSVAGLFAEAIRRLHRGGSLVELLAT
jgi:ribose-phosphate pyrophosphokinase